MRRKAGCWRDGEKRRERCSQSDHLSGAHALEPVQTGFLFGNRDSRCAVGGFICAGSSFSGASVYVFSFFLLSPGGLVSTLVLWLRCSISLSPFFFLFVCHQNNCEKKLNNVKLLTHIRFFLCPKNQTPAFPPTPHRLIGQQLAACMLFQDVTVSLF